MAFDLRLNKSAGAIDALGFFKTISPNKRLPILAILVFAYIPF
jgi:hypothetical protein